MIRPANSDDLPGIRAIASGYGLLEGWPAGPDFLDAEHALGRLGVAVPDEAAGGVVAGFTGTLPRGPMTHLGDLFVRGDVQSRGLGRALLEFAIGDASSVTTFASTDPRARSLYRRAGMVERATLHYFSGRLTEPPPTTPGYIVGDLDRAIALDSVPNGGDRAGLLRWYAARDGVRVTTAGDGYAFTREVGSALTIGPARGRGAIETALHAAGARTVHAAVPDGHWLAAALRRQGVPVVDADAVMCTTEQLDLTGYLPHSDLG